MTVVMWLYMWVAYSAARLTCKARGHAWETSAHQECRRCGCAGPC